MHDDHSRCEDLGNAVARHDGEAAPASHLAWCSSGASTLAMRMRSPAMSTVSPSSTPGKARARARRIALNIRNDLLSLADVKRLRIRILLRRATLGRRTMEGLSLDADVDEAVEFLAAELKVPLSEVLQTTGRNWLIDGSRAPSIRSTKRARPTAWRSAEFNGIWHNERPLLTALRFLMTSRITSISHGSRAG